MNFRINLALIVFLILSDANYRAYAENNQADDKSEQTVKLALTEQLAYSTVIIEVTSKDGTRGSGTGFFFSFFENKATHYHVPVIITNKHVIKDAVTGKIRFTLADEKRNPIEKSHKTFELLDFEKMWLVHPDPKIDLAIMPIAWLLEDAEKKGMKLFYISLNKSIIPSETDLSELTSVEDILMVGYPIGIWDEINNFPVFRRGITATHPSKDYNGRKEFMIDAACFPGSSGSPVFLYNPSNYLTKTGNINFGSRIKFLGVLYAGPQYTTEGEIKIVDIPTKKIPISISPIPTNLGYVIKSEMLLDFEKVLKDLQKNGK